MFPATTKLIHTQHMDSNIETATSAGGAGGAGAGAATADFEVPINSWVFYFVAGVAIALPIVVISRLILGDCLFNRWRQQEQPPRWSGKPRG